MIKQIKVTRFFMYPKYSQVKILPEKYPGSVWERIAWDDWGLKNTICASIVFRYTELILMDAEKKLHPH